MLSLIPSDRGRETCPARLRQSLQPLSSFDNGGMSYQLALFKLPCPDHFRWWLDLIYKELISGATAEYTQI